MAGIGVNCDDKWLGGNGGFLYCAAAAAATADDDDDDERKGEGPAVGYTVAYCIDEFV